MFLQNLSQTKLKHNFYWLNKLILYIIKYFLNEFFTSSLKYRNSVVELTTKKDGQGK